METKVCRTCKEEKPVTSFFSNGTQPNGRKKYKPDCGICSHFKQKSAHYNKIASILQELNRLLECELCGYNKNWSALCFHHIEEEEKEFEVNEARTASRERVKAEIEKCALLCHNCHMEVHYPQNKIVVDGN